jgi:hypothetical protein
VRTRAQLEAHGSEAAIGPAIEVGWLPRAVAGRAMDAQLKSVAGDVADGLEGKRSEHGANLNAAASQKPICQQWQHAAECGRAAVMACHGLRVAQR